MNNGIPTLYWIFRWSWSLVHLIILGVFAYLVLDWALTDNHAIDALTDWLNWSESLREYLSGLVRYPWE